MAKLLLTAPVTGIRGKVGGVIFSANKSGPHLKIRPAQLRPSFPSISEEQIFIAGQGRLWAALGGATQALWNAWAALAPQDQTDSLGNLYSLSGWQWYNKINAVRRKLGRGERTIPPSTAQPSAPTISTFTLSSLFGAPFSARITYPAGQFAGFDMFISAAVAGSFGRNSPVHSYQPIFWRQVPGASSQVFEVAWVNYFGSVIVGQRGFIFVRRANSHTYLSPPTLISSDAVT